MTEAAVRSLRLPRRLLEHVARPGDVVLDPYAGSGSTLVAAVQEGMHFVGIEREAKYVEIARARAGFASGASRSATATDARR